jgi:hypothetical protein
MYTSWLARYAQSWLDKPVIRKMNSILDRDGNASMNLKKKRENLTKASLV